MTGIGLIIVFILAIALMIFCISKLKIHPSRSWPFLWYSA